MKHSEEVLSGRTKLAKARKQLTPNELFFYEHAGYSHDPKTETAEQGRIRCAKELAEAERIAHNLNWETRWENDWDIGSHKKFYGPGSCYEDSEPTTCEYAQLWDADGMHCLASLGCIDDATSAYRRVIEAELADEALAAYDREIEILDAH